MISSLLAYGRFSGIVSLMHVNVGSAGRAVAGGWLLPALVALSVTSGCGPSAPPPPEGRLAIENVAKWRQLYQANHNRNPPPDEAAFLNFVEKKLKERGEPFDRNAFLVSPRDGQKYVVRYGKESANLSQSAVSVHEKEGHDGKLLVAFESGRSLEVEASELPSLLSQK
jgi:hypothetical protein